MSIFLTICLLLLLGASTLHVFKSSKNDWEGKFWLPYVVVKWIAGVFATWVYIHWYEGGDLLGYIHDAKVYANLSFLQLLSQLFTSQISPDLLPQLHYTLDDRAVLMSKIVAVFYFPTENIWLTAVTISHVSAIVSFHFVRKIIARIPEYRWSVLLAFLWLPSALFWGSGIFKESLTYPAMLLVIVPLFIPKDTTALPKYLHHMLALLAIILLWKLKYYVAAILAPVLFATWLLQKLPGIVGYRRPILWLGGFLLPMLVVSQLHPNLFVHRFLDVLIENHLALVELSHAGSVISFPSLKNSLLSVLWNLPLATFFGIFRPLFGERFDWFPLIASLENSMLFVLAIVLCGGLLRRKNFKKLSFWVIPIVVYVFLMAGFMALSTPNLGTLARYKIAYWPFFVFLILAGWQKFILPEVKKRSAKPPGNS